LVFENWHFVLLGDGELVQKCDGDAPSVFVLIKTVHFVAVIKDVL